ncbi:MAG: cell wall-binding repeat-containing protein [Coriobacteriia bacterium]
MRMRFVALVSIAMLLVSSLAFAGPSPVPVAEDARTVQIAKPQALAAQTFDTSAVVNKGALPPSPVSAAILDPADSHVYTVNLTAGQVLDVAMTGSAGTDFDLTLSSTSTGDPVGLLGASSGLTSEERVIEAAPVAGTYYLIVDSWGDAGTYTLTWSTRAGVAGDSFPGVPLPAAPVARTIGTGDVRTDFFSVHLDAGQVIDVVGLIPAGADFDLLLCGPWVTWDTVWTDYEAGSFETGNERITYCAPATGTYYLIVDAVAGTGSYTLDSAVRAGKTLEKFPGSILPPSPVSGMFVDGDTPYQWYMVQLEAGELFEVTMTFADTVDYDLWLLPPSAAAVTALDAWVSGSWTSSTPETFGYLATETGTYYLAVEAFEGTGPYSLHWMISPPGEVDVFPGVPLPASPVVGEVSVSEMSRDHYSVYLDAGEFIDVSMTGPVGTDFDVYLLPTGSTSGTTMDECSAGSWSDGSDEHFVYRAPVAGTYYIVVVAYDGSGSYTLTHSTPTSPEVTRIAGSGRVETAVELSKQTFGDGDAYSVVIATARNWPDALGGSALAAVEGGPILLTEPGYLPQVVADEIVRLGAMRVVILGGVGAVSDAVLNQLDALPGVEDVERIYGDNRYQTADAIAAKVIEQLSLWDMWHGAAFVATGESFPDALSASPLAGSMTQPIFLLPPQTSLQGGVIDRIDSWGVTDVQILGGTGVVPQSFEDGAISRFDAAHVDRLYGDDRYSTSIAIAEYALANLGFSLNRCAVATGQDYPDALAGGPMQSRANWNGPSVLLLTHSGYLDAPVETFLSDHKYEVTEARVIGGTGAVAEVVRGAVRSALE